MLLAILAYAAIALVVGLFLDQITWEPSWRDLAIIAVISMFWPLAFIVALADLALNSIAQRLDR